MGVSGNLWIVVKDVKKLVVYDVDRGGVMEPMQVKLASSQFNFGYTEQFCITWVTSLSFSSCEKKYEPAFKPLQGNPAFF